MIEFSSMDSATWGGFEAAVDRQRFAERLKLSGAPNPFLTELQGPFETPYWM